MPPVSAADVGPNPVGRAQSIAGSTTFPGKSAKVRRSRREEIVHVGYRRRTLQRLASRCNGFRSGTARLHDTWGNLGQGPAGHDTGFGADGHVMPSGYNILFVLVDQEHFFPKWPFPVPAREAIKKKSVTFLNHQAASCVCSSARSVIYTGQHIQHTGIADNLNYVWQRDLATSVKTVGHRLADLGYHAAYQGKWHLSAKLDLTEKAIDAPLRKYRETIASYGFKDFFGIGDLIDGTLGGYSYDDTTLASAITWLRTEAETLRAQGRPWYLAVNFVNPHDVMYFNSDLPTQNVQGLSHAMPIARAPDDELYRATWDDYRLPASRHQSFDSPGRPVAQKLYQQILDLQVGRWPDEDRRWKALRDYYFNAIRDCDRKVALLLDALRNNGMDKNTIVIFTADHGELGGNHQMRGKGTNAYRQQNHLPLMIHHPAFEGGTECEAVTSQLDLTPTIIGLTGSDAAARARASEGLKGQGFLVMAAQPGPGRLAHDQTRRPVQLRHVVLPGRQMGGDDRRHACLSREDARAAVGRAGEASAGLPQQGGHSQHLGRPLSLLALLLSDALQYAKLVGGAPRDERCRGLRPPQRSRGDEQSRRRFEAERRPHRRLEPGGQPTHRRGGR